jgi:thiamine biosynthesis lipoprotein ApbE
MDPTMAPMVEHWRFKNAWETEPVPKLRVTA